MCNHDPELGVYIGTIYPLVTMATSAGKNRKTLVATIEQLFHVIQSITFSKAEPFKQWTAQVVAKRLKKSSPELILNHNPQCLHLISQRSNVGIFYTRFCHYQVSNVYNLHKYWVMYKVFIKFSLIIPFFY